MRILFICFRSKGDPYETRIQILNSFLKKLNEAKKILITIPPMYFPTYRLFCLKNTKMQGNF